MRAGELRVDRERGLIVLDRPAQRRLCALMPECASAQVGAIGLVRIGADRGRRRSWRVPVERGDHRVGDRRLGDREAAVRYVEAARPFLETVAAAHEARMQR